MIKFSQEYKVHFYTLANLQTYKPNAIKLRYTKLAVVHVSWMSFASFDEISVLERETML